MLHKPQHNALYLEQPDNGKSDLLNGWHMLLLYFNVLFFLGEEWMFNNWLLALNVHLVADI